MPPTSPARRSLPPAPPGDTAPVPVPFSAQAGAGPGIQQPEIPGRGA